MRIGFFPAFFDKPLRIKFETQEPNEKIELFLRQHWAVNVPWIVTLLAAFILPAVLIQVDSLFKFNLLNTIPLQLILAALVVWYLLLLAYFMEKFLFWYFNIYIVTNLHLVDINFHSLLSRDITEIELNDIQSVSAKIGGVFSPLFNFGNVAIKTAADKQEMVFTNVPRPDLVADRIQDLRVVYISHIHHDDHR